jgi:hypothetical protein
VLDREGVVDPSLDGPHGLVGESLQPQDPRQREACDHSLVELKAHDVRAVRGSHVALQHPLGVVTRQRLLSEEVEGDAH